MRGFFRIILKKKKIYFKPKLFCLKSALVVLPFASYFRIFVQLFFPNVTCGVYHKPRS